MYMAIKTLDNCCHTSVMLLCLISHRDNVPNSKDIPSYSHNQKGQHSLLEALATAVAMAWAVALATVVEAAEASALPKEP